MTRRRLILLTAPVAIALLLEASAIAQGTGSERRTPGSTLTADLIRDLPAADNPYLLFETTQPTLITDRFLGGGLYAGQPARVGGFLSSWTQTLFRVGDVDITDANGAPLLFPGLAAFSSVDVATGMLSADIDSVGLAVTFEPRRPTARWTRTFEAATSHFGSARADPSSVDPPAIAALDGWDRASIVASGPLVPGRLGLVAAGSWTRGSQFERAETAPVVSRIAAAFAHLVFTPTAHDEVRTVGWLQHSQAPFDYRSAFSQPSATTSGFAGHAQSTWEHSAPEAIPWRAFASYTRRHQAPVYDSSAGARIERLRDGPVQYVASIATNTHYRWSVGGRVGGSPAGSQARRHVLHAGIEADGSGERATDFFSGEARELVDGVDARSWRFARPGVPSFRHQTGVAAFASDRFAISPRLELDAGVRYDTVSGSADGARTGIRWGTLLPRAGVRWSAGERWQPAIFAGYARSAYRLPLGWLAFGDPAAPTADVFRRDSAEVLDGPLVARTGPGTAGDPDFSGLDPDLERPLAAELVLGLEVRPRRDLRVRLTGTTRSERRLVGLSNIGPVGYARANVFDPGANVGDPADDRLVPVDNRLPESFGRDRWLLTNLDLPEATFEGIEVTAELARERLLLILGATAGRSETPAANRGFGPLENDQGLVGEITHDPNASTFARGRPFADRAYTGKVVGVFRFPTATTLGVTARYQDGQPFSRMLVFRALNQGAEAVRAFASGDSRFMFTGTLDARLQQGIAIGSRRADVIVDAYNLLGLTYSVEEQATQLPDVRTTTAIQPPRALHVGLRLVF